MWTLWHDHDLTLTPTGPKEFTLLQTCERCAAEVLHAPATIHAQKDGLNFSTAGKTVSSREIRLSGPVTLTAHGETVTLHDPVDLTAHAGVLVIVVTLPVENYVERVVASESGPGDSLESLKALAIVVRSFALHEAHGHADYDLCDSTHCQLLHWSGSGDRRGAAHAATLATAGETLWFHGQRALAYFGKDCGGRTASPDEIWPRAKLLPYLPSQPDPFCTRQGAREWAPQITRSDLTAALAAHGLAKPGWQNLSVARRGASGRAVTLQLDHTEISAEDFQLAVGESLGWNKVPSTWFEVSRQGDTFAFHGRGWGHGVGLCQKGAAAMAAQGRTTREILAQYFPGAEAADESTGRAWQSFAGDGFVLESLDGGDAGFLPDLNRARAEASGRSGLHASTPFTVRAFPSTPAFRQATLAAGWVAAFTEGNWIGAQPLRTLAARQLLADTMRHEFLHALVEREAGSKAPLWLREGLVEAWSEAAPTKTPSARPKLTVDQINAALAHSASEDESEAAHRAAAWYAAQLLARYGRAQVLDWLRSDVPASVVVALGQR
ncbi:MAG: SpoIID/LytB domain-containing protein [Terracidiphilus sp.]|nr:SpoIID/LytB domain-containing protein [Terracidiphilus sp.]